LGNVSVIGANGGAFSIIFGGLAQNVPVSPFNVTTPCEVPAELSNAPTSRIPTSEVQTLTFNPNILSGSFTLALGNLTTGNILWSPLPSVLAANIQRARNNIFGAGAVGVVPQAGTSNTYVISFRG